MCPTYTKLHSNPNPTTFDVRSKLEKFKYPFTMELNSEGRWCIIIPQYVVLQLASDLMRAEPTWHYQDRDSATMYLDQSNKDYAEGIKELYANELEIFREAMRVVK